MMNKIENLINYLSAKKPKNKKQRLIQIIVGLSLGIPIGFMIEKPNLEKTCKRSMQTLHDDINRQAAFMAMSACGFHSFTSGYDCIGVKEEMRQEIEKNREITLEERLCSYLIEK